MGKGLIWQGMTPHYQSLPLEMGSVYLTQSPLRALGWWSSCGKCVVVWLLYHSPNLIKETSLLRAFNWYTHSVENIETRLCSLLLECGSSFRPVFFGQWYWDCFIWVFRWASVGFKKNVYIMCVCVHVCVHMARLYINIGIIEYFTILIINIRSVIIKLNILSGCRCKYSCLSLCVSPSIGLWPVQDVLGLLLYHS